MSTNPKSIPSATKRSQLLFFKDVTWHITADGIGTFMPEVHASPTVINHKVTRGEPMRDISSYAKSMKDSLIMQFLRLTSAIHWRVEELGVNEPDGSVRRKKTTEEEAEEYQHLCNKMFSLGYLAHQHKSLHTAWFVLAQDYRVILGKEKHGGTGKSLFFKLLEPLLFVKNLSGGKHEEYNSHRYGSVEPTNDIVCFDDMHEQFSWRSLFPFLTGDFAINPRMERMFTIPFRESPKMCGNTIYSLSDDLPNSLQRKILPVVFSDYFHAPDEAEDLEEASVYGVLGKQFFTDFTASDWDDYYNVMATCIQYYLSIEHGFKISPPKHKA